MSTFLRVACGMALGSAIWSYSSSSEANGFTEISLRVTSPSTASKEAPKVSYATQPLQIFVSLNSQQMRAYRGLKLVRSSRISSGKKGHNTPRGIFSILEKKKYHESNLYNNAPMPFMQRLTWSGIALHQGNVPNYPASHGCIRMPKKTASSIFNMSEYRDHVIISFEDIQPTEVKHPALFQPAPDIEANFSLRGTVKENYFKIVSDVFEPSSAPLRMYLTRATQQQMTLYAQDMMQVLGYYNGEATGKNDRATRVGLKLFQRHNKLERSTTVNLQTLKLLTKKTGRDLPALAHLYVKQNYRQIYETPIVLDDPAEPLGSQLLVTYNYTPHATQWIGSSISTKIPKSIRNRYSMDKNSKARITKYPRGILDRLTIPNHVQDKISKLLTPGSSLAISDNGIGNETNKSTDYIVQTH